LNWLQLPEQSHQYSPKNLPAHWQLTVLFFGAAALTDNPGKTNTISCWMKGLLLHNGPEQIQAYDICSALVYTYGYTLLQSTIVSLELKMKGYNTI